MSALTARPRQHYDHRSYRDGRRTFSASVKRQAWARCAQPRKPGAPLRHACEGCGAPVAGAGDIVFDHIVVWEFTRDSSLGNCQVLCLTCDRLKTSGRDIPAIRKAGRQADFHLGIAGPGRGRCPMPCGKASGRSKTMAGKVVPRETHAEKHARFLAQRYGAPS